MIKFSIIIPVRTINDFLRESISYLKKLDYPNFEVLIISDYEGNFDLGDSRFKYFICGPLGPGEKRNIGAKRSTGEILVFLDDDAYPRSNWLNEAEKIFRDSSIYALGGPALTPSDAKFKERMSGRILESSLTSAGTNFRHVGMEERDIDDYPTVNLFVRKKNFMEVGGFPIEFWPGEDTKLCLDLVSTYRRKFKYSPKPVVYHHRRDVFFPHLKQVSRYGQHRGQFAKIFPETSRLPSYFMPSAFVLGLFLGPVACLFIPFLWLIYFSVVLIYLLLLLVEGIRIGIKEKSSLAFLYGVVGIFLTHVYYGINFIVGLIRKPELELRKLDKNSGNYIGG